MGTNDDNDDRLGVSVFKLDGKPVAYFGWCMYFGYEVRDNTKSDFESWAIHYSELFDEGERLLKIASKNTTYETI